MSTIPDLNTGIANAAEMFFGRRSACEQRAREILSELDTPYARAGGAASIKAAAAAEIARAKTYALHEVAARTDGFLLRTMSGDPSTDLMYGSPELAALYSEAQKFGRVRYMKPAECEEAYNAGYECPVFVPE